jgi:hypothetical protein
MPYLIYSFWFILEECERTTVGRGGGCKICGRFAAGLPGGFRVLAVDRGEDAYKDMYLTLGDITKLLRYHIQSLTRRQLTQVAEYLQSIDECHLAEFQALHHDQLMRLAMEMPTSPALQLENVSLRVRVNMARAVFVSILDQYERVMRAGGRLAVQSA